jgi:hypothetical protein
MGYSFNNLRQRFTLAFCFIGRYPDDFIPGECENRATGTFPKGDKATSNACIDKCFEWGLPPI